MKIRYKIYFIYLKCLIGRTKRVFYTKRGKEKLDKVLITKAIERINKLKELNMRLKNEENSELSSE